MKREHFERLALEHLTAVHRFAWHLTRNATDADDLVQDVYLRALKAGVAEQFEERGGGMKSWLFTIARTTFLMGRERRGVERRAAEALALDALHDAEVPAPSEVEAIDWQRAGGVMRDAVNELPDSLREVLVLWSVEGLKYREIADVLGVPIGTVMSRLHRARTQVSMALSGDPRGATAVRAIGRGSSAAINEEASS